MPKHKSAKAKGKAKKAKKAKTDPALRTAHEAIRKTYHRVRNRGGAGSQVKMKKLYKAFTMLGNVEI